MEQQPVDFTVIAAGDGNDETPVEFTIIDLEGSSPPPPTGDRRRPLIIMAG